MSENIKPRKNGPIARMKQRAYIAGYRRAADVAVPELERKYRFRAVGLFWVWVYVAFGLGLAIGLSWGSL